MRHQQINQASSLEPTFEHFHRLISNLPDKSLRSPETGVQDVKRTLSSITKLEWTELRDSSSDLCRELVYNLNELGKVGTDNPHPSHNVGLYVLVT